MTKYTIQLRNPATGQWVAEHTITPLYQFSTIAFRRWLFFRRVMGFIPNMRAAEKHAHKLAVRLAKKMYWNVPTRVERVSKWNGIEVKDVIWQNGRALMSAQAVATK